MTYGAAAVGIGSADAVDATDDDDDDTGESSGGTLLTSLSAVAAAEAAAAAAATVAATMATMAFTSCRVLWAFAKKFSERGRRWKKNKSTYIYVHYTVGTLPLNVQNRMYSYIFAHE